MLLSAGALWFLGILRSHLLRAEGGNGHLTAVAYGAGVLGFDLQAAIQAPQRCWRSPRTERRTRSWP